MDPAGTSGAIYRPWFYIDTTISGLAIGVAGLGFQFFLAAKTACDVIGSARSLSQDMTFLRTRFHIEQIKSVELSATVLS